MKLIKFCKGQMAIVMTLAIATLLGVMALGADVGVMYYQWNQLQKGADAAALAGANYLYPGAQMASANVASGCVNQSDDVKKAACTYAINNGLASDPSNLTINEPNAGMPAPNVQVIATRSNLPYMFGRVIGLTTYNVAASATATELAAGGAHIFPVGLQCNPTGVPLACSKPAASNTDLMLTEKFQTANGGTVFDPGNWSWLGPDGGNVPQTAGDIVNGSTNLILYGGTVPGNTGNFQNSQQIGNAFNTLVTEHNTMASSNSACNTSYSAVCAGTAPCFGDPLAVIVPLVNFNGVNGANPVPVYGFAELYLNSAQNPTSGTLEGCFVTAVNPKAVAGNGPKNGVISPPTLVQ